MDLSKFKTPDWLIIGGAVGIFIFGFFEWVTVKLVGFGTASAGTNVFDFFWTGTLPWFLIIASAVVIVLLALEVLKRDQLPWPLIILAATALAALLLLIRLIFNPIAGSGGMGGMGVEIGRGIGMILSVVSGLVAAAGGFLNFQAHGGDIKDLTDVNKLKASFNKGDDTPPPPPPPAVPGGSTPPPAAPGGGTPPPPPAAPGGGTPPPPAPPA